MPGAIVVNIVVMPYPKMAPNIVALKVKPVLRRRLGVIRTYMRRRNRKIARNPDTRWRR